MAMGISNRVCVAVILISFCWILGCDRQPTAVPNVAPSQESQSGASTQFEENHLTKNHPTSTELLAEFKAIADRLRQSENRYYGRKQFNELLEVNISQLPMVDRARHHMDLSFHHLRVGNIDEAVTNVELSIAALKKCKPTDAKNFPGQQLVLRYALTYLRLAEERNCIARHNCDCCIFPLSGGGIHVDKAPAMKARQALLQIAKGNPEDYQAIWLLNLVTMALAEYPQGVPEDFRIPESAFDSDFEIKKFSDVAGELGIDALDLCGGTIVEDFNGDNRLDIVSSTYDAEDHLKFFVNSGDSFSDQTEKSNLSKQFGGLNCIACDYDGDGDSDILVLRGAWLKEQGEIRNSLLRNDGNESFTDVTAHAGLAKSARPTQAAVWGDFNGDSFLDLYVVNESRSHAKGEEGYFPAQLFINQGDNTFIDQAMESGVTNDDYGKGVTAGDYDNDGDLDIYVSNVGPNRLYRNDGDGTFEDVAPELGLTEPAGRSFATWFFDVDNDGWLDLFVAAYHASLDQYSRHLFGLPQDAVRSRLYRNLGDGRFEEIGDKVGLDFPALPMGANFGDLDNDGYLDVYLATGDPLYETLMPNIMLRNDQGKRFQDVTTSGGFGHLQKGHGVAFADFDNDGDQDIYHQLGGFFPGDKFRNVMFRNPGHDNHFLTLKLVGTKSHRSGIGARIEVVVETGGSKRSLHRAVGSVSSFGGSPSRQEIGLGAADRIEKVVIKWPSGKTQRIEDQLTLDSCWEVSEDGLFNQFR